ncbi:hypothetical protein HDU98_007272 [Podochytrium sp. JEL0797]|nr:hypothetical protein HDU98_007272 [Podochytrium sp. JEL0797]
MDGTRKRRAAAAAPRSKYVDVSSDEDDVQTMGASARRGAKDFDDKDFDQIEDVASDDDFEEEGEGKSDAKRPRVAASSGAAHSSLANANHPKRDAFLWAHRDLFVPLLPPGQVNHFSHLRDRGFAEAETSISPRKQVNTPTMVTATLKDYQLKGLEFLAWMVDNGMNAILGDEMGLGKTLQTLSMLAYMKESGRGGPFLVVCPLSVLSSWEAEIKRWTPTFKFIRFHGPLNERNSIKKRCTKEKFDIYLTTYEQLVAEAGWFRVSRGWRCVVLDEGHKIKNDKANMSAVVYSIPSQYRFILTGTPLQNNLQELWALLHYLYPTIFTQPTSKFFADSFNLQKGKYNNDGIEASRKLLDLIMLRRLKTHVDLSIPPREELIS